MKKVKLTALSLTILMISSQLTAFSTGNSNMDASGNEYFEEYFAYEELNELLDIQMKPVFNVKIFDSANNLVATGNENDEKIKNLIPLTDLLTEIDGTKYYRLSYP